MRIQIAIASHLQERIAFLPYKLLCLSAEKATAYAKNPVTLGDHMRKVRIASGLLQKEAAHKIGVSESTLVTWELNQAEPATRFVPKVVAFLGYDPFPEPTTLGERIVAKRRALGIARKRLAYLLDVDEGAFRKWEGGATPTGRCRERLEWFLSAAPEEVRKVVPPPGRAGSFERSLPEPQLHPLPVREIG